ncbi:MAG: GIY-YIG nuclease family protein [Burkholderiales bacterium]
MNDIIYALYFIEGGCKNIFYVGRSNEPYRRYKEHLRDEGNSKKAKFIRFLLRQNYEILYERLCVATQDSDEMTVIQNLEGQGHVLVNSKSGDIFKGNEKKIVTVTPYKILKKSDWVTNPVDRKEKCTVVGGVTYCKKSTLMGTAIRVLYPQESWVTEVKEVVDSREGRDGCYKRMEEIVKNYLKGGTK